MRVRMLAGAALLGLLVALLTPMAAVAQAETTTGVGTFTFVPNDPSQPTYTGRETFWDGENSNSKTFTATSTDRVNAFGSDGSRLTVHVVAHITVNANGTVTVRFENDRLSCG